MTIVESLFREKQLSIRVDIADDLPLVSLDCTRIRQVFINLLNNAARFTDRGGVIVSARRSGQDVVVQVADTGIGISSDDLAHVFEEFHQLEAAHQRQAGGSGLGLPLCKKFVELHGGNIWATSSPGQGTTFTFTLPLALAVVSEPLRAPWETWVRVADSRSSAGSVLVISSDPGSVRLFERHLTGYEVLAGADPSATEGLTGLRAVIRILDHTDDLASALRDVRSSSDGVPWLICRLPSERDLRQDLGVTDYLIKPFSGERLLAALERVGLNAGNVLVVDDDPSMIELIGRFILSTGRDYRLLKACDGAEALEILDRLKVRIDLLFLDLMMPPPDGLAVLAKMRTNPLLAHIPVVVISARGFIDQGLKADVLAVTRGERLSVREVMSCTRAIVEALNPPASAAPNVARFVRDDEDASLGPMSEQ